MGHNLRFQMGRQLNLPAHHQKWRIHQIVTIMLPNV